MGPVVDQEQGGLEAFGEKGHPQLPKEQRVRGRAESPRKCFERPEGYETTISSESTKARQFGPPPLRHVEEHVRGWLDEEHTQPRVAAQQGIDEELVATP